MTSKEALKLLYSDAENYAYFNETEEDLSEIKLEYELIKQDLERLEKLKKAIEILKGKTIIIFALKLSKDLSDYNRMTSFKNLTQEEYDFLKEYLDD